MAPNSTSASLRPDGAMCHRHRPAPARAPGRRSTASVSGSTAWPPNWLRRAAMAFMAIESSCWDTNRAYSAAEMTGVATPRSTASCTVQRPSPESLA